MQRRALRPTENRLQGALFAIKPLRCGLAYSAGTGCIYRYDAKNLSKISSAISLALVLDTFLSGV